MAMTTPPHRGHLLSYAGFAVALGGPLVFLVCVYPHMDALYLQIWEAREGWYLGTYRPWGGRVWRVLDTIASSRLFACIPLGWLLGAFAVQDRLQSCSARNFNGIHAMVFLVAWLAVYGSFLHVGIGPVAQHKSSQTIPSDR